MRLKKTDVAIIFSADGAVSIEVPKIDPVPEHMLIATAIAVMVTQNNKSLMRLIKKQVKIFEDLSDKERNNND
jgi:hypothetical protein